MGEPAKKPPQRQDFHYWVVQQHDEVAVVHQKERPSDKVEVGERLKVVYGPFGSQADATKRRDDLYSRTHRAQLERMGM
jgi:hypothetical protein